MNLSLTKIQSFVAIADARQFSRAAEQLELSQPTLSAHIRDLEAQLGVRLLRRTTRSVMLTVEGARFLERVRGALSGIEEAVTEVHDHAQLRQGRLSIAVTPTVAANLLPGPVATFQSHYPNVEVNVAEEAAARVYRRVETGEADFGVAPLRERSGAFISTVLRSDRFVAVVPRRHALAKRQSVRLEQLVAQPLLTTAPDSAIRQRLEEVLEARGLRLRTRHQLVQHQSIVAMVSAGIGVAFLPLLALGQLDCSGVVILDVMPAVTRDVGIIERKGGAQSAAAVEFLRIWRIHERKGRPRP